MKETAAIEIRILSPDDWQIFRCLRLDALREAPYAFGSTLADWSGERDTEARWRSRLTEVPFNAVAYLDGVPVGIVSGTEPNGDAVIELISMWVAPDARGRSAGEALVRAVVDWAQAQGIVQLSLDVREGNSKAIDLYERCGFADRGPIDGTKPLERRMLLTVGSRQQRPFLEL